MRCAFFGFILMADKESKKTGNRLIVTISGRGADSRTRTDDLRITNALLYQLSHISTFPKRAITPLGNRYVFYHIVCRFASVFLIFSVLRIRFVFRSVQGGKIRLARRAKRGYSLSVCQNFLSRFRYCTASATWAVSICSLPAKSAMVRDRRKILS